MREVWQGFHKHDASPTSSGCRTCRQDSEGHPNDPRHKTHDERGHLVRSKGLSDLRTATTSRIHAKPPQKGTEYLNLYLLDKEAQRLVEELAGLEHRRKRIQSHLAEIRKTMAQVEGGAQHDRILAPQSAPLRSSSEQHHQHLQWKKLAVDY